MGLKLPPTEKLKLKCQASNHDYLIIEEAETQPGFSMECTEDGTASSVLLSLEQVKELFEWVSSKTDVLRQET